MNKTLKWKAQNGSNVRLCVGDAIARLSQMKPNLVHSVITDPPYGLKFMGKKWDHGVPGEPFWKEALRVARPGAVLLAFGGTRTYHRMACAIEDAGWELRDTLMWLYGSGFPKSHNLKGDYSGYGTALKPAWEPIIMAMKPCEGTFVQNMDKWGVAGLNIDECRVSVGDQDDIHAKNPNTKGGFGHKGAEVYGKSDGADIYDPKKGRWPANLLLDPVAAAILDAQSGNRKGAPHSAKGKGVKGPSKHINMGGGQINCTYGDEGGASRFFYVPKASRAERTANKQLENKHPTVKPIALMTYLCLLTRPPSGGIVLDPFMGTGTTGIGAVRSRRHFIGVDSSEEDVVLAKKRIKLQSKW